MDFVKIKLNKEHFIINENYNDELLNESKFWTEDVNSSIVIKSNKDLTWLDEN